jgi:hypothetical protein
MVAQNRKAVRFCFESILVALGIRDMELGFESREDRGQNPTFERDQKTDKFTMAKGTPNLIDSRRLCTAFSPSYSSCL